MAFESRPDTLYATDDLPTVTTVLYTATGSLTCRMPPLATNG